MPSSNLVPTGIQTLDDVLNGGVPSPANLLVYGDPLCGKKPLLMQFIYEGLRKGIPGIFVLTDYSYPEWKAMMESSGWMLEKYEKNGLLQVVDCYSRQFNPSLEDEGIVVYVSGPTDLIGISMQLSALQEHLAKVSDNYRLGLHSLSSLFEVNDPESVFRFMQFITGKFRKAGAVGMYVMERGMHEEKQVHMTEHLVDGVIEFSEDKIHTRGLRTASPSWFNYEITDNGIKIQKSIRLY
ncbi:MAG: RAD55 family ATPase [Candidatus Anstonellaceae archaeon]